MATVETQVNHGKHRRARRQDRTSGQNTQTSLKSSLTEEMDGNGSSRSDRQPIPRADEFKGSQLEEFGMNYRLTCLIINGRSPRQALEYLASEYPALQSRTERWAQKLYKRYKQHGVTALIDHRRRRKPEPRVLTSQAKKVILAWWYARPAAGPAAISKLVSSSCKELSLQPPGYESVKKYLASLADHDKLVRAGKIKIWNKQGSPVVRFNLTAYSNQRWQMDHTRLDIWIRVLNGNKWEVAQVWLSVVLDAHSRSVAGFILSRKVPDAWTTALLIRQAVLQKDRKGWHNKGIPEIVQPDCGKDFKSHAVAISFAYLGIYLDFDPPHYPNRKGKIERFFLTIDRGCLRALPGHMDAVGRSEVSAKRWISTLLTREQLYKEIENYIVEDYHQRTHSETGRKPGEHWEQTVRLRMPESEDALNNMLLKSDKTRRVQRVGIVFQEKCRGGAYWAPTLVDYWGQDVQIRYNPEDPQSILVYHSTTHEFICEAWLMGQENSRYTIKDIKRTRSQFRVGLTQRMTEYAEEIRREDRRFAEQAEWQAAAKLAESTRETSTEAAGLSGFDEAQVDELLDLIEREARGKLD